MPTKIQWCRETWNPVTGCTKCSPGCLNCYAERMAARLAHMGQRKYQDVVKGTVENWFIPEWNNEIHLCDEYENVLDQPLHWRKPRRIFVCSMSDLFHPKVPFEFIDKVWCVMFDCMNIENNPVVLYAKSHTFLILTKRPKRLLEFAEWKLEKHELIDYPNVHIGVSISNQAEADEKIPILLQIPAAVRWLSIEPMLEGIDLSEMLPGHYWYDWEKGCLIDWIVVGCESGPKRRFCNSDWALSIVKQCKAANVPCFVKQLHDQESGKVIKMPKGWPQQYPSNS